jgi:predicted anti-sigma-YlaC factor YlaD
MHRRATPAEQCLWACQRVSLRLDDELSELEQARLEAHLASCAGCRAVAAELEGLTQMVRTTALEDPSIAFHPPRRRNPAAYALRAVSATAAVTVMALSGLVGLSGLVAPNLESNGTRAAVRMSRERMGIKERLLTEIDSVGRKAPAQIPAGVAGAEQVTLAPNGARAHQVSSGRLTSSNEGR